MGYTQIENIGRGRGCIVGVCVTVRDITFTYLLRRNIKVTKYVGLYTNDEGFLCFKFFEQMQDGLFTVTDGPKYGKFVRIPTFLKGKLQTGRFEITEDDGYIVTGCKVNLEK